MKLRDLAWPVYKTALTYLTTVHVVFFLGSIVFHGWPSGLSLFYYLFMLPGSGISLGVFTIALPLVSKHASMRTAHVSVHLWALVSCLAGGTAIAALFSAGYDEPLFELLWWYLPFPMITTWLAVLSNRRLIRSAVRRSTNAFNLNKQADNQFQSC